MEEIATSWLLLLIAAIFLGIGMISQYVGKSRRTPQNSYEYESPVAAEPEEIFS